MPLYVDDDGRSIITNSMLMTMRRCAKQTEFKYVHRLKPRLLGAPLRRGQWVHSLLEEDANGGDWKALHKKFSAQFEDMFDEEKEHYGDMPTEIYRIMTSYFWHYKNDPWKYLETELELDAELPNGMVLRGKVDALIENQFGLWLVDHKSHKTLPHLAYRMLDTQSPFYTFLAIRNKIKVQGFIWNYVRWKAPTIPQLVYVDTPRQRLSKRAIDTDYPTFARAIKRYGIDHRDYAGELDRLKAQRYVPGEMQTSPFFWRSVMEKHPDLIKRVLKELMVTAERFNNYDFTDPERVERTVGRHCEYMCSYTDICSMQLLGGNIRPLLKQNYKVGDPMSYYHDKAGDDPRKEE